MPLTHIHRAADASVIVKLSTKKFALVDSGLVGVSIAGKTPFWSTGFSGCIGLVLCGSSTGGALIHFNQMIQGKTKDLELALKLASEFVKGILGKQITDALIYYGDPGENRGCDNSLDQAKVKKVLGCDRLIDLRRTTEDKTWGSDFVYDPQEQIVYTAPNYTIGNVGLDVELDIDTKEIRKVFQFYGVAEADRKKLDGFGHKGWFFVP
jgi:hypothetical protein